MKPSAAPVAKVDAEHPWLGLVSFTEENRTFFYGREEEVAELSRRVQRKPLTVLFGQSGLGKTSILQAGLVPRLRPEGFCPVYVRLDYDPASPRPADQIKRAVFLATAAAGTWTQTGAAVSGESLWEFLHHRDDVLKDPTGRVLTPLLIFDQFEEIFTLAQSDDVGRRRAEEFLSDLADLVENRPPAALEERIERDEADAAKFDFARADYRVLISLREDYLAHLEALKARMPSVTQNRMRLARMTGGQAVAAVRTPAPQLVSETVAEAVVRFVAGGADLAHAEVEPSLLSLICRELNETRLERGQAEISADLLAGSRATILSEFYERALADQPPGVRAFIEDEMLTDSGFRESVAEERVRKAFAAAGAHPGALAQLVDRRLLRVEDRLDLRRVEITHDVLCGVVAASRTVRRERDALERSRRELLAQREREQATRRALVRARMVAAICAVLMVAAVGSAGFGWIALRRARAADAQTQAARQLADVARGQSEKLIGFLLDDFYLELVPTGRADVVGTLADKAVAYYDGLPPALMTPETRRYQGMALIRKAMALAETGHPAEARSTAARARMIFAKLRATGDHSDETTTGLALALYAPVSVASLGGDRKGLREAVGLLRPIIDAGRGTRGAKLAFGDMLQLLAHMQPRPEDGIKLCEESRGVLAGMGALNLTDLTAASIYADVTDSESRMAEEIRQFDRAMQLSRQVAALSDQVLAKRPGDLRALRDRYFAANLQGILAEQQDDPVAATRRYERAREAMDRDLGFDPTDALGWHLFAISYSDLARVTAESGRIADALKLYRTGAGLAQDPRNQTGVSLGMYLCMMACPRWDAQRGDFAAAALDTARAKELYRRYARDRNEAEGLQGVTRLEMRNRESEVLAAKGDYRALLPEEVETMRRLTGLSLSPAEQVLQALVLMESREWVVDAALQTGRYTEAIDAARELLAQTIPSPILPRWRKDAATAQAEVMLGQSLAGLGRRDEALATLRQVEGYYRQRFERGDHGVTFSWGCAREFYALAEAQSPDNAGRERRSALLADAARVLAGLSVEARQLATTRELDGWIRAAQAARAVTAVSSAAPMGGR